ncbi:phospholipase D-like domain-containing protein [Olleya aquimaris]|uniref:Phospholipase D-like protein n=1 Tax=Olleya aquimaris TaxID=639310 RepID=A0A327R570_9FLAO|nr:phospholipase D-like domain-containing protein [Olleya aquimaris]RAJ11761.1 phospholipase D-like protein [Olleya aquimaris]
MNKNNFISTNDFHATDLFEKWKKLITKAEKSILIFTPYLDFTINILIKNSTKQIPITIITSLEGDSLFQRGYQLNALKEAIGNGILVKNLIGLHAKILVIDNSYISLGSQNFTNRGRKNKEAGMISETSFVDSKIISTLKNWEEESKSVSLELLEELILFLSKNEEPISKIKKKFDRNIEKIISDHNQRELEKQIANSSYFNSTYRFAQGEVILTRTVPPPNYDYYSFFAQEHNNLCKWIKTIDKGQEEQIELEDYKYYPAINVNTMQMTYLRIHTSRITFMKSKFDMSEWNGYEINKIKYKLDFSFLKSSTKNSNIKVTLSKESIGKGSLYYFFNGSVFLLIKTKYSNDLIKKIIEKELISRKKRHNEFLKFLIEPAKFTTQQNQPKEIEKFLPEYSYRVGILEYKDLPILIFNKR